MSGPCCHGPFTGRLFQIENLWSGWLWTLPHAICAHVLSRDFVNHPRMMPRPLGKVYLLSHLTEIVPAELWEQFLINMDFFELFRRKVSLLLLLFGIILAKMIEEYLICSVRILGCAIFYKCWLLLYGFTQVGSSESAGGLSCGLALNCFGPLCANVYFNSPCPLTYVL